MIIKNYGLQECFDLSLLTISEPEYALVPTKINIMSTAYMLIKIKVILKAGSS